MDTQQQALLRLHLSPGIGRVALFNIKRYFGDFISATNAPPQQLEEAGLTTKQINSIPNQDAPVIHQARRQLEAMQVQLVSYWDANYPELLKQIHDPPAILYVRGELPGSDYFAIVGSRRATAGGRQLAQHLATSLAEHGVSIVSGLARGIDSAAHRGALAGQGTTVAVLGCGIDQIYPRENNRLYHEISHQGAVITEYPPGTKPLAGHFPGRNRIISGLSRGVLIVEAAEGSGSLITGDFALEQGRELFATPGAISNPTSRGVNQLLKEGASLVTEAEDILQNLWPQKLSKHEQQRVEHFTEKLSGKSLKLYQTLSHDPLHIDEIGRKCGLTPMEVSAILLDLELQGGVQVLPGNSYIRGQL